MKSNYQIIFSILLLIAISLISITIVSASAYNTNSPYLRVVAEEVSPEPVQPGQDVTVKIRLTNDGGETAEDVSLKLNANYPFFIKTESNNFENKRTLCVGCSIDNTFLKNKFYLFFVFLRFVFLGFECVFFVILLSTKLITSPTLE